MINDRYGYLLDSMNQLCAPDYTKLNKQDDRLLHAVLYAYAKHHADCVGIGWDELSDILRNAICEEIGDYNFYTWAEKLIR